MDKFALQAFNLQERLAQSQFARAEKMAASLTHSGDAAKKVDKKSEEEVQQAAQDFEALLIQKMVAEMWKTVPKNELMGKGREQEYYHEMLHKALAEEIAEGQGIGIKEVLMKDMRKMQQE